MRNMNLDKNIHISFTGEYHNSIDQKNRFNIPAKFRKALSPINNRTFVLTRGFDPCLWLYPIQEWKTVEEQLSRLSSIKNRDRNFVRSIVRYAVPVKYDRQGRIQVPENLLSFSKIQKDVVAIGMIKKIELWNPDILNQQDTEDNSLDSQTFDDLANEINF